MAGLVGTSRVVWRQAARADFPKPVAVALPRHKPDRAPTTDRGLRSGRQAVGPTRPGGTYVNRNFLFLLAGDAVAIPVKVGRGPGLSPAQRSRTRCSYRVEIHPVERAHDGIG
jgi:hypothetical protein